jgi:glycosyltransferase involved in cell wall biosynthesis
MACKVPTIATRVGGVSELIDDGVTGRLFAVGDVAAMAIAAIELLADESSLARMGDAGRRAAQDRYCASRIIPQYERYYERVLARAEV